jgi:hypothetical protein
MAESASSDADESIFCQQRERLLGFALSIDVIDPSIKE